MIGNLYIMNKNGFEKFSFLSACVMVCCEQDLTVNICPRDNLHNRTWIRKNWFLECWDLIEPAIVVSEGNNKIVKILDKKYLAEGNIPSIIKEIE